MPRYRTYHNNLNYNSNDKTTFRPKIENPIPLLVLVPTYEKKLGVTTPVYMTAQEALEDLGPDGKSKWMFYGSFKTYGGTETYSDDLWVIKDTATIETWFRPDIKSDCRIYVPATGAMYDIINEPENIGMRNQFLKFKCMRLKGGA